jgi:uncharacterized protein (TIGR02452 family)
MPKLDRSRAAALGQEAVAITTQGHYLAQGRRIEIGGDVARAVAGTTSYPPGRRIDVPAPRHGATRIEVTGEDTLAAARRLTAAGGDVAALNFASAKNPGGGFLGGARAQEEALCRSSALFACLDGQPMYDHHRADPDALYTDWTLHSPAVPVFRDDTGALLDEPFRVAFLTCPAVNAKVTLERDPMRRAAITEAMRARVDRVLAVAAAHGHDTLVLGAWGCGVFRNDPAEIADLFGRALEQRFAGQFAHVVFAVLDSTPGRTTHAAFARRFAA